MVELSPGDKGKTMSKQKEAELWQQIAKYSVKDIFGSKDSYITDKKAQSGYIGSQYKQKGILLIGMNPAGDGTGVDNDRVYAALEQVKTEGSEEAFDALNQVIAEVMPSWPIYKNCIKPIIEHLEASIHEIALINLLPWRAEEPHKLYEISWQKIVNGQVDLLAPERIIALGGANSGTGYYVRKFYKGNAPIESVRRSIGDKRVAFETLEDIAKLTK